MRSILVALCLQLLTSASAAQEERAVLKTWTHYGVFAESGQLDFKFVPRNTVIQESLVLTATSSWFPWGGASATTRVSFLSTGGTSGAVIVHETGHGYGDAWSGTHASNNPQEFGPPAHSLLLMVPTKKQARATVIVSFDGTIDELGGRTSVAIDIGNDNSVEFSREADISWALHTQAFPVRSGEHGITVRITTLGRSTGWSAIWDSTTVVYVLTGNDHGYSFERYGEACPLGFRSLSLVATEEHGQHGHAAVFHTVHANPDSLAVMLLGTQRQSLLIGGTCGQIPCSIHLVPLLAVPHRTDASGSAVLRFGLPNQIPVSLLAQDVLVYGASCSVIETTNGIALSRR